jgi:hypothetical protein
LLGSKNAVNDILDSSAREIELVFRSSVLEDIAKEATRSAPVIVASAIAIDEILDAVDIEKVAEVFPLEEAVEEESAIAVEKEAPAEEEATVVEESSVEHVESSLEANSDQPE